MNGTRGHQRSGAGPRGFALLEVLVGSIVMGIALVVIVGLTSQALSAQRRGEQMQIAAMLADEQLNLVLMNGTEAFVKENRMQGSCPAPFALYRYRVDVERAVEGEPTPVIATILWDTPTGEQSLTIRTMIAPRFAPVPDRERKPDETVGRSTL